MAVGLLGAGFGRLGASGRRGAPAWVQRDDFGVAAVFDADYTNARYFYRGAAFSTEAALNTAVGLALSGITRTSTPYVDPAAAELIANGTFGTDTSGWQSFNGATLAAVSGELVVTAGGGSTPSANGSFVAALGKAYKITGSNRRSGASNSGILALIAQSAALAGPGNTSPTNSTFTMTPFAFTGAAEANPAWLALRHTSGASVGDAIWDNISAKECIPFLGFNQPVHAGRIELVTPSAVATTKVAYQLDDGGGRNYIRVEFGTDQHLRLYVRASNANSVLFDFGVVAFNTAFVVEYSIKRNRYFAKLSTVAPQWSVAGGLEPGLSTMRIARSSVGETWDGTIGRVTIFSNEKFASNFVVMNGDSYVGSAGGVSLPGSFKTAGGRDALNIGVGGTSLAQQVALVKAYNAYKPPINVVWDGRDTVGDLTAYVASYTEYANWLGHGHFVFIPPVAVPTDSGASVTYITAIRDWLASNYPNNYVDWHPYITNTAGVVDASQLQGDGQHLLVTPMNAVAAAVDTFIAGKGWY